MTETFSLDSTKPQKKKPKWLYASLLLNFILLLTLIVAFFWIKNSTATRVKTYLDRYYDRKTDHFKTLPDEKDEIIFVGNSITEGANWSEVFQNPKIKNRGISADISAGVLARLPEIIKRKPHKLFLMIGTNDLERGVSIDDIVKNTKEILTKIKTESPQTQLYLQSVLPISPSKWTGKRENEDIILLNKKIETVATNLNITYIDLHAEMIDSGVLKADYSNDGLHLVGKGYEIWKTLIEQYINEK